VNDPVEIACYVNVIADVVMDEFEFGVGIVLGNVLQIPRHEIVHGNHAVSVGNHAIDEMRPNEARTTSDQYSH
jgi:hypothetical protein